MIVTLTCPSPIPMPVKYGIAPSLRSGIRQRRGAWEERHREGQKQEPESERRSIVFGTIYNISMKRTTKDDKTEKVGITLPIMLVRQTDKARGDMPRSTFIRRALEQYIRGNGGK